MLIDQERTGVADIVMEAERTHAPALQLSKAFPQIEIDDPE